MAYDSTVDAVAHIKKIQYIFNNVVIPEFEKRAKEHDQSKFESPEKETYDKYIPMLQKTTYGSKEYYDVRKQMAAGGTEHHYQVNRHHPEHFENGIRGMNLFDLTEMFFDSFAASLRSDTGFEKGLEMNKNRFGMSDDLYQILVNTYNEVLKDRVDEFKAV